MKRNGFTLIELLVVVAIIGILAAVGVVAYSGYVNSAKHNECRNNHKKIIKTILEKKALCEFSETIKLKTWYSSFKEGAEYNFDCSSEFIALAQSVGTHLTNVLRNPYTPNNHWRFDWMGNSASPTTEGWTFYHNTSNIKFRVRTLCNGKVIESIIQ